MVEGHSDESYNGMYDLQRGTKKGRSWFQKPGPEMRALYFSGGADVTMSWSLTDRDDGFSYPGGWLPWGAERWALPLGEHQWRDPFHRAPQPTPFRRY